MPSASAELFPNAASETVQAPAVPPATGPGSTDMEPHPSTLKPVDLGERRAPPPAPATFKHSTEVDQIFAALSEAQGDMENPQKTKMATVKSERASYTYWYCDIADVLNATRKPFKAAGLGVMQFPDIKEKAYKVGQGANAQERIGAVVTIETILTHKSGQWVSCSLWSIAESVGPQALGSVITYLRRYGLQLIAGIAADDDEDGEAAQGEQPGGAGNRNGQPAAPPPAGPQRAASTTPDPWIVVAEVMDYREQPMGGGRVRYMVELSNGIGWVGTTKKDLGQKIARERGTGLSVKVQLKRFREDIDLVVGEVVHPGADAE